MFGIRGLDPFGLVHALLGVAALILGLAVLLRRKGTRVHRQIGQGYVLSMLLLNATALMIYDLHGRFGPFHAASALSLATVGAGFVPVYLRRPRRAWMLRHATFMCWSYVGLLAAFVSEVAVRVPGVGFGSAVIAATVVVVAGGRVSRIPLGTIRQLARSGDEVRDYTAAWACDSACTRARPPRGNSIPSTLIL